MNGDNKNKNKKSIDFLSSELNPIPPFLKKRIASSVRAVTVALFKAGKPGKLISNEAGKNR